MNLCFLVYPCILVLAWNASGGEHGWLEVLPHFGVMLSVIGRQLPVSMLMLRLMMLISALPALLYAVIVQSAPSITLCASFIALSGVALFRESQSKTKLT